MRRGAHSGGQARHLVAAGVLLGVGLGGFVDGIVFHQLLQLHNMLSARLPVRGVDPTTHVVNLEINMFWDGVFHAFTWTMTVLGLALLWRAVRAGAEPSTRRLVGALALGWGLFNLVEGVVNHHILHVHHVTETEDHLVFDLLFLASGALLVALGVVLVRGSRPGRGAHVGAAPTTPRPATAP